MVNLILLTGILIYAWKPPEPRAAADNRPAQIHRPVLVILVIFLVIQVKTATSFG
jgi:hypothetical protein